MILGDIAVMEGSLVFEGVSNCRRSGPMRSGSSHPVSSRRTLESAGGSP